MLPLLLGRLLPSHSVFCQYIDENLYNLCFKFLPVLNKLIQACHLEQWHLESITNVFATIVIPSWWQTWKLESSFTHLSPFCSCSTQSWICIINLDYLSKCNPSNIFYYAILFFSFLQFSISRLLIIVDLN